MNIFSWFLTRSVFGDMDDAVLEKVYLLGLTTHTRLLSLMALLELKKRGMNNAAKRTFKIATERNVRSDSFLSEQFAAIYSDARRIRSIMKPTRRKLFR